MSKYRLKFSKMGKIRYIGHLDLLKVFQRAVRRSGLPIAYSKGFNPHQIMGFALPLPLGMESTAEYIDVELEEDVDVDIIKKSLSQTLPTGMEIINARRFYENEKAAAAMVKAADYEITLNFKIENAEKIINEIMSQEEIKIEKKSKGKIKTADIKKQIFEIIPLGDEDTTKLKVRIAAGSSDNLKPELLVNYICGYMGYEFIFYEISYIRTELYKGENGNFSPLI